MLMGFRSMGNADAHTYPSLNGRFNSFGTTTTSEAACALASAPPPAYRTPVHGGFAPPRPPSAKPGSRPYPCEQKTGPASSKGGGPQNSPHTHSPLFWGASPLPPAPPY